MSINQLGPGSASPFIFPNANSMQEDEDETEVYRPRSFITEGNGPACLVNASVTYCDNNQIYVFGGFDQYTDDVYNHVLCLDVAEEKWRLVDNFGDIPGVRMGHTANLWQGDKLVIFGGENEHRSYLSDVIIFDIKTARWRKPQVYGPTPRGRARHASVLYDDKLFIIGGVTGRETHVLDEICFLDLKTFTWSRTWRFVARYDHSAYVWNDHLWVFGGLGQGKNKISDLCWLDLKSTPAFNSATVPSDRRNLAKQPYSPVSTATTSTSYVANSRSAQVNPSLHSMAYVPPAPGAVSCLKFMIVPGIPGQIHGTHHHIYSGSTILDIQSPGATSNQCSVSAFDLDTLRWRKIVDGNEFMPPSCRWHYCTMNPEGTMAWLLGSRVESNLEIGTTASEEFLCNILEVDLTRYGILGHSSSGTTSQAVIPKPQNNLFSSLSSDLATLINDSTTSDFTIIALTENDDTDIMTILGSKVEGDPLWSEEDAQTSSPIYVHCLILKTRWPHFNRVYNSQMAEYHNKRMHIPEPYSVVMAFVLYLYTDTLISDPSGTLPSVDTITGLFVMSHLYAMQNLRQICINRLGQSLDLEHVSMIWFAAWLSNEGWLRKRAAQFAMENWGLVVRTDAFMKLPKVAMLELIQEIDTGAKVLAGEEVDVVEAMRGGRFVGMGGSRRESITSGQQTDGEYEEDYMSE